MKRNFIIFFVLFIYLFRLPPLDALNRDYLIDYPTIFHSYCGEEENFNPNEDYYFCVEDCLDQIWEKPIGIRSILFYYIPETGPACTCCGNPSIYLGYMDRDHIKYISHFKQHLEYSSQQKKCLCLWPEYSKEAAQISDMAYLLFRDLISTTVLSVLLENENEQKEFVQNTGLLNTHGLSISFIAHQFRFSDYYHVCRDIEKYAVSKYKEKEYAKIKNKLEDILEALYSKFYALYTSCYKQHPNPDIDQEIRFMKLLVNDISGLDKTIFSLKYNSSQVTQNHYDSSEFIVSNLKTGNIPVVIEGKNSPRKQNSIVKKVPLNTPPYNFLDFLENTSSIASTATFSPQSHIFLEQGTLLNNLLLHKEAIQVLTQAIELVPSLREAYIERAMAYFETNQLSLALKDYELAKKLTIAPPFNSKSLNASRRAVYIPENKLEFSKGLIHGTVEGAEISAKEFVPSIFSCCRGILNGLWAFACSPNEVGHEMINAAYGIGEYLSDHSTQECFQCVVPELKELSLSWHKLNDHSKGQKIGFIIGKYGVDIFAPAGALKGVNKIRALKRANTMFTLESCSASHVKQAKIIEESTKRAIAKTGFKQGKIFVKNSNVQYHIMQKKHGWDKVVMLSGNIENDFARVIALLEESNISDKAFLIGDARLFPEKAPKIMKVVHEKPIGLCKVHAEFEINIEMGTIFLQDAWVVTK